MNKEIDKQLKIDKFYKAIKKREAKNLVPLLQSAIYADKLFSTPPR